MCRGYLLRVLSDLSLVADVLREASYVNRDFDFKNLANYLRDYYSASQAKEIYEGLLADAGLSEVVVR